MNLIFLPQPKQVAMTPGTFTMPAKTLIAISDAYLHSAAKLLLTSFPRPTIHADLVELPADLRLIYADDIPDNAYHLDIESDAITIAGADEIAVWYGCQTLLQILRQCDPERLPCLHIEDWPDFPERGVYYDVCRGRVPNLEQLLSLADVLAAHKINHLQLYIEHTFAFRGHPKIGSGASPLMPEEILHLDEYCSARHIELVPSLASFGHMSTILRHPEYQHLAEDKGVGEYVPDEDDDRPAWFGAKAWTITPALEESYTFLDSLFAEFLPLFRSERFNVCCDETWDLGLGQSYAMCKSTSKGRVYLGHILRLRELAANYGKRIMFWGDIIRHYPSLIEHIPDDVTVLDWGYAHNHNFDAIDDFRAANLPFFACPGTSSWVSLFPRLQEAMANIAGFAAAGKRYGAEGLLNTDWGDGGHYNFMEYSWHGYLFGAEQAWNTEADQESFTRRFARLFLQIDEPALPDAIEALGAVSFLNAAGYYQSIWQHIFFAKPGDPVLAIADPIDVTFCEEGEIRTLALPIDAELGRQALETLIPTRVLIAQYAGRRDDSMRILTYWLFAADTLAHAARKLTILGPGGDDSAQNRRMLSRELRGLRQRFEELWMEHNRRSEIRITLDRYDAVLDAL